MSLYTLLSINFISVFISLYVYLVCVSHKTKPKIYNPNAATKFDEFFLSLFSFILFRFSHFLSGVNFLLYLNLFLFLFVNHLANANLSAILSRLSFFFLVYFVCFFGVVSLAQPHFRIFRMKFLFGNFTRTRTRSCCSPFPLSSRSLSHSLGRTLFLVPTNGCLPGCLVVVSITVRSVRTCTYTHKYTSQTSLDIDTDVKNTADFYTPNAGLCHWFAFTCPLLLIYALD